MTGEQYTIVQEQIFLLGQLVRDLPLDEFIQKAQRADAIGPIINPTLWMRGNKNLQKIIDLAVALREFQGVVLSIAPKESEPAP